MPSYGINAKYGTLPQTDSSPDPHKSYHTLNPPGHRPPSHSTATTPTTVQTDPVKTPDEHTHKATISSLNHVLPSTDIEGLLDLELGNQSTPTIHMMQCPTLNYYPSSNNQHTLQYSHRQAIYLSLILPITPIISPKIPIRLY